ncbi:RsmE family RNA methyltransferase [Argonema antarcticum]|uniref:RsmE family RNA methyltransferase n=1 Tax=Argonema antarcticum TaxID=2942763 RepID=UPI002013484C|nr:16S rRNA (uracil(1498)-N(3))-methyltransferase [Argonema antarcticum]MCL1469645.1 16S rRNA (uracil(1498)-N(3))-methyltransferase [Argonema antarcticum A004/B2]
MTQLQRLAIAPSQLQDRQISLTAPQQHYLSRVLRLETGDRFIAMNGQGQWWLAKLQGEQAEILEPISVQTELPVAVTLMVALPKGNGFDDVVRQVTELGVTCIIPTISDRTLLKPSPQKLERWRRIVTEAAEQSERQIVPTILDPVSYNTALAFCQESNSAVEENSPVPTSQYICVARGDYPHLLDCLIHTPHSALPTQHSALSTQHSPLPTPHSPLSTQHSALPTPHSALTALTIATGPEGGWTDAEIEKACAASFQPVSLGRRILTAVLAPIVALSLVAGTSEMGTIMKKEG